LKQSEVKQSKQREDCTMIKDELFDVIVNFENALKAKKLPDFDKNRHRVEQVLRILKVDFHNFNENENQRACNDEMRKQWEQFWDFPEVRKSNERKAARLKEIKQMMQAKPSLAKRSVAERS